MNKAELLVDRMKAARNWTLGLLEDIKDAAWFTMPAPNTTHVAWQVGHLAVSQVALVHVRCFDRPYDQCAPDGYRELFGKGSTPVAGSAAYPSIDDIRSAFDRLQDEVIQLVSGMSESSLAESIFGENHPMFSTKEGAIGTAVMHDTFHAGQIAILRRLAGKAPLR